MKPITQEEVRHLHHRWCVVTSFLEVGDCENAPAKSKEGKIYRGCKDGSIVTCRALCQRFGIPRPRSDKWKKYEPFNPDFKTAIEGAVGVVNDEQCASLWNVLATANKCVAHLDSAIPDHPADEKCLRDAIEIMKRIILRKLADANLSADGFI